MYVLVYVNKLNALLMLYCIVICIFLCINLHMGLNFSGWW
jgi:hypothetical protein